MKIESALQTAIPTESFAADGFALVPAAAQVDECEEIAALVAPLALAAGSRCLLAEAWCQSLASRLRKHPAISKLIPLDHLAVQCSYFEKSAEQNWLVPVHQDLSIPVAERVADPALTGWSEKEGSLYVHAPLEVLEQLVAVRLHLDPCEASDGPLRVIPGSHRRGILSPEQAVRTRQELAERSCELQTGGALVLHPLLLHASSKAKGTSRRRVLHFVFGPPSLGWGLRWQYA